jgi:hypothetical protein
MKLFLLILLFPFLCSSQILTQSQKDWMSDHDDVGHFYGVYAVGELSHGIQTLIYKERSFGKKLFIDWLISQAIIFGKETFDKYKANPTGFNGWDIPPGELGCHVRLMIKVSYEDFKQVGFKPRKKKDKYYLAKDL